MNHTVFDTAQTYENKNVLNYIGPQGGPQQGGYNNWNWGGPGPQGGPGGPGPNGDMYGRGPNPTNGGPPGAAAPTGPGVPGVKAEPAQYGAGYGTNGYGTVSFYILSYF